MHEYYDLRNTDRPVDAFSDQIAKLAAQEMGDNHKMQPLAHAQGFRLEK